jgi:hypothetical protein
MIKARDAKITWNCSHTGRVYDVRVRDRYEPAEERTCSSGAAWPSWMLRKSMQPEAVFAEMLLRYGFTSPEEARIALLQFSKIDTCVWARAMLKAETYGDRP